MSITNFSIATASIHNADDLVKAVGAAIAAGWQPHGPVVVANNLLHQPLVKGSASESGGSYTLPTATTAALGGVLMAATVANSTAADVPGLTADFNALLVKLRAAGLVQSA